MYNPKVMEILQSLCWRKEKHKVLCRIRGKEIRGKGKTLRDHPTEPFRKLNLAIN